MDLTLKAVILSFVLSGSAWANDTKALQIEFHGGSVEAEGELSNADIGYGYTGSASFSYSWLNQLIGIYGDIGASIFDARSASEPELESGLLSGSSIGAEHQMNFGPSRFGYYVRAGVFFGKLALLDRDGDDFEESSDARGLQLAAGIKYHFSDAWALRSGFQYNSFSADLNRPINGNDDIDLDLNVFTVGASFKF